MTMEDTTRMDRMESDIKEINKKLEELPEKLALSISENIDLKINNKVLELENKFNAKDAERQRAKVGLTIGIIVSCMGTIIAILMAVIK
jgi:hypothetical protein